MNYLHPEIIKWLGVLLFDRFGVDLELSQPKPGVLKLTARDQQGCIEFDKLYPDFYHCGNNPGYATWKLNTEEWHCALDSSLPMPGGECIVGPLVEIQYENTYCHYDIPGLCFWMLARIEELNNDSPDLHSRFSALSSHAYRNGYLERPVVDEWLHILRQMIRRQWPALNLSDSTFQILPSHDVDLPSAYTFKNRRTITRIIIGHLIKRRDIKLAWETCRVAFADKAQLHPLDPANTFDWIMSVSEKHNLKSAFYFICGGKHKVFDADYRLEHPAMRELLNRISRRGHEIGLHPSYESINVRNSIIEEFSCLRQVCTEEGIQQTLWGGRMHYLRYIHPSTSRDLNSAGLNYDSSLGYADHAGFRCGTCFEFRSFDPVRMEMLDLKQRPLIMMEASIISTAYMGLGTGEKALKKIRELKDSCKAVKGNFTVLWHNSELHSDDKRALYEAALIP